MVGGTSGIGLAVAAAFAGAGDEVVVTGVDQPAVDAAAARGDLRARRLDVTDPAGIDGFFSGLDRLDVLVNCAGVIQRNGAEFDPAIFARVIDVNLNGTMRACLAAHRLLKASRGAVVNTASMLTFFGSGPVPAYASSKGGVGQLTKSLAVAWAPDGIRVNAVAPGWIATDLTRALVEDPARSAALLGRTPMARWGAPADVAGPVLFLCSEAAAFVTGVVLPVDGGYSAA